jgi:hypothetical protein
MGLDRNAMFLYTKSYLPNRDGDLFSHRLSLTRWPFLNFAKALKINTGIVY